MKKMTFLIVPGLLFGLTQPSCKKESLPGRDKFENLRSLVSAADLRIAFEGLTSPEKADFWKYNIQRELQGLSPEQRTLVREIDQKLFPSIFQTGSADNLAFTTLVVPGWLKKAERLFPRDKLSEMFYFLEGEKLVDLTSAVIANRAPLYDESAPDCLCNIGSAYSCRKREIKVGTNGAEITTSYGSCGYSYANYVCDRDDYGCGFMGLWSCNGNACNF